MLPTDTVAARLLFRTANFGTCGVASLHAVQTAVMPGGGRCACVLGLHSHCELLCMPASLAPLYYYICLYLLRFLCQPVCC